MAKSAQHLQESAIDLTMDTAQLPGREVLDRETFRQLNVRSDLRGTAHFAAHLLTIAVTGWLVHATGGAWFLLVPAMMLHGVALVTLFAPMHECTHRTAFRSRWLNQAVGWIAGVMAFYNSDYYRRYHYWHHRYTQDPARDPELAAPKPRTMAAYILRLSGLLFWRDKMRDMMAVASGRTAPLPFVPEQMRRRLAWSMRAQAALYLLVAVLAVAWNSTAPLVYWLLPLLLGQPVLRAITFAEHTGCSEDANGLTNTRTTLTTWPVRFLMWNMPYHAEHHLYPSIPFHALPRAHARLRDRIAHLDPGYIAVHRAFVRHLSRSAPQPG